MNWHEYPILRLLAPLILGILFYLQFPSLAPHWSISIFALLVIAFLAWPRKYLFPYKHRYLSGLLISLSFFIFGIALSQFHYPYEQTSYFALHSDSSAVAIARIVEPPQEKPKSIKLNVDIEYIESAEKHAFTEGMAVLYLEKDSNAQKLEFGDRIIMQNNLQKIKGPQNPDEFDYRNYLYNGGIQYQMYLRKNAWNLLSKASGFNLKSWAFSMRNYLLSQLQAHNVKNAEYSVASAMLLGVRKNLSPELRQAFSSAGAMHILCVSGLHVGIIFMLLNYLLSFLNRTSETKKIKTLIILGSIWLYALITGLSPSVVRAATMFSFISVGQNIGRQVNIYNSLAASAFLLLIFNPYLILDVGFQLSYAAVIAIVSLQKPLQNLWTPPWPWLFKIWQLATVSIAAQIGTAPLALYYFHSFPNYFLLTNLIVIPASFIIFLSGVVTLAFSWSGIFADYLGWLLSKMVAILNWTISGIQGLPFAVSSGIYINSWQLIILICLIILTAIMLIYRKPRLIFVNLILVFAFIGISINQQHLPAQFIAYQTGKYDYLSFTSNGSELALTDADILDYPQLIDYQCSEHRIRYHIKKTTLYDIKKTAEKHAPNFFREQQFIGFMNLRLVIINPEFSLLDFSGSIPVDYIVLSDNPQISLKQLLKIYQAKQIIIGPTNAPWTLRKWKKEFSSIDIPVWVVNEQGAFVVDIY